MSPKTFLVLGLPRSRTFWLSKLFTTAESFCFHELSTQVKSVERMANVLTQPPRPPCHVTGNSDSAQILVLEKLLPRLPQDTRFLFVRRNRKEATDSFLHVSQAPGESGGTIRSLFERVDRQLDHWQGVLAERSLVVPYESLNESFVVRSAWKWLTHDLPFPEGHYLELRDQRLTIPDEAIQAAIRAPQAPVCAVSEAFPS